MQVIQYGNYFVTALFSLIKMFCTNILLLGSSNLTRLRPLGATPTEEQKKPFSKTNS